MRVTKVKLFDAVYDENVTNYLENEIEKWRKEMLAEGTRIAFNQVSMAFNSGKVMLMVIYEVSEKQETI